MKAEEFLNASLISMFIFDPRHRTSIEELLREYAKLKCKEQRENCAQVFRDRNKNYTLYEQLTNVLISDARRPEL